jgi:predicted flap endonuclease-1-like 5' DNA nuclease
MAGTGKIAGSAEARGEIEARLRAIPNVGPAIAGDLIRLGIAHLEDMAGRDPDAMCDALCDLDGRRHDPCLRDVFAAVVAYANGEEARPWWAFTPARKARDGQSTATNGTGRSGSAR